MLFICFIYFLGLTLFILSSTCFLKIFKDTLHIMLRYAKFSANIFWGITSLVKKYYFMSVKFACFIFWHLSQIYKEKDGNGKSILCQVVYYMQTQLWFITQVRLLLLLLAGTRLYVNLRSYVKVAERPKYIEMRGVLRLLHSTVLHYRIICSICCKPPSMESKAVLFIVTVTHTSYYNADCIIKIVLNHRNIVKRLPLIFICLTCCCTTSFGPLRCSVCWTSTTCNQAVSKSNGPWCPTQTHTNTESQHYHGCVHILPGLLYSSC